MSFSIKPHIILTKYRNDIMLKCEKKHNNNTDCYEARWEICLEHWCDDWCKKETSIKAELGV